MTTHPPSRSSPAGGSGACPPFPQRGNNLGKQPVLPAPVSGREMGTQGWIQPWKSLCLELPLPACMRVSCSVWITKLEIYGLEMHRERGSPGHTGGQGQALSCDGARAAPGVPGQVSALLRVKSHCRSRGSSNEGGQKQRTDHPRLGPVAHHPPDSMRTPASFPPPFQWADLGRVHADSSLADALHPLAEASPQEIGVRSCPAALTPCPRMSCVVLPHPFPAAGAAAPTGGGEDTVSSCTLLQLCNTRLHLR